MSTGDLLACPGCRGALLPTQVDGRRHYLCGTCGGAVIGIAVLRQVLAPGTAGRLWATDESDLPAPPPDRHLACPFCGNRMVPLGTDEGAIAACRPCEMVWIDKQALASLPMGSVSASPPLGAATVRCPHCGAPVSTSWDEHCRYCGATLKASTTLVVIPEEPRPMVGGTLLGRAIGRGLALLARAVFDWWSW